MPPNHNVFFFCLKTFLNINKTHEKNRSVKAVNGKIKNKSNER